MDSTPNYYAIIPADVRYDSLLSANAKLLYGEITALCNSTGSCWAENEYFARLYDVSISTISRWVSSLKKQGYIEYEIDPFLGNKRTITLCAKSARGYTQKAQEGIRKKRKTYTQKAQEGIRKKRKPIYENTTFNNTINNTVNKSTLAFDFLKTNCAIRFENEFVFPYQNQIKKIEDFTASFNDTCEQESLEFEAHVLIPRIRKYARAWINNQNKFSTKIEKEQTLTEKRTNPNYGTAI